MVRISEINSQNPWWGQGSAFTRYDQSFQRAKPIFFKRRQIELKKGQIYVLRGPRQVGKTTYLKETVRVLIESGVPSRDILYLSMDFFTSRRELRNAISYFLEVRRDAAQIFILLDEITFLEDWNLELKYMADQGILAKGVVIATGSSAVKLKEKGELLPGRGLEGNEYYLKPLSFRTMALESVDFLTRHISDPELAENLEHVKNLLPDCSLDLNCELSAVRQNVDAILPFKREFAYLFRLYLSCGGFPGVINHYFNNRFFEQKDLIESSVAEIYTRDVFGDLTRLQKQEIIIRQILRAISERLGSRYSFSKLAQEIEKTHVTAIDYLEYMEDSFISFMLYAYDFNKKYFKAKGDKKVYFYDPFIYYSLRSYLEGRFIWQTIVDVMQDETLLGKIVEGVVMAHLRMLGEIPWIRPANTFLWYYYDKNGKEIDAIIRADDEFVAVEVKYQTQVDSRELKKIAPVKKYLLLSKEDVGGDHDTAIVPVDVFLALLPVSERIL